MGLHPHMLSQAGGGVGVIIWGPRGATQGDCSPRTVNHYSCPETLHHGKGDFLEKKDFS